MCSDAGCATQQDTFKTRLREDVIDAVDVVARHLVYGAYVAKSSCGDGSKFRRAGLVLGQVAFNGTALVWPPVYACSAID